MKEKNGEHPFGDSGQLVLLVLFLLIWVVDSFFLQISTFLSDDTSLYIRLVILSLALMAAVYLVRSGHVVVSHGQRPAGVVSTGAFQYVRHPLFSIPREIGIYASLQPVCPGPTLGKFRKSSSHFF